MFAHFSQGSGGRVNSKARRCCYQRESNSLSCCRFWQKLIFDVRFAARHALPCKTMWMGVSFDLPFISLALLHVGITTRSCAIHFGRCCASLDSQYQGYIRCLKKNSLFDIECRILVSCDIKNSSLWMPFDFVLLCLTTTYKNQRFPRMRLWLHPTQARRNWFQVAPWVHQFCPVIRVK